MSRSIYINYSCLLYYLGISAITQIIIFANQSTILSMRCLFVFGGVVRGNHMYTVGIESDTWSYFTAVTIMISLPTGTKIFN